jgi:hypothetical protein
LFRYTSAAEEDKAAAAAAAEDGDEVGAVQVEGSCDPIA